MFELQRFGKVPGVNCVMAIFAETWRFSGFGHPPAFLIVSKDRSWLNTQYLFPYAWLLSVISCPAEQSQRVDCISPMAQPRNPLGSTRPSLATSGKLCRHSRFYLKWELGSSWVHPYDQQDSSGTLKNSYFITFLTFSLLLHQLLLIS